VNEELQQLIAEYKKAFGSLSEKQRAEEERDLYELACPDGKGAKREWMVANLGGQAQHYEHRAMLIMAGPWVDPLWKMFDEGVSRQTIVNLFRQARNLIARKHLAGEVALQQVIEEYNKTGHEARTPDGKIYRRRTPMEKQRSQPPPSMSQIPVEMDMDATQNRRSKQFFSRLIALTDEYVRTSLVGLNHIDELEIKIAKDEFSSYIREACEDFRRRVYVMRSSSKKDRERRSRITREQLRQAAEVLGIPFVWDRDVDLKKAKKIMLRRLAQLHPDKGATTEAQKAEYTAVREAYDTLERYMEGRQSHAVGERSHEGQ
jgi:hypothetical protein